MTRKSAAQRGKLRLTLQRRYLLSLHEDDEIDRQLLKLRTDTGFSISRSCFVRSALKVLTKYEKGICEAAKQCDRRSRPPNGDLAAQEQYESLIASIMVTGIRKGA